LKSGYRNFPKDSLSEWLKEPGRVLPGLRKVNQSDMQTGGNTIDDSFPSFFSSDCHDVNIPLLFSKIIFSFTEFSRPIGIEFKFLKDALPPSQKLGNLTQQFRIPEKQSANTESGMEPTFVP
jgi:hypothetical protein